MDSCLHRNDRIERIKATERFLDVAPKLPELLEARLALMAMRCHFEFRRAWPALNLGGFIL